MSVDLDVAPDGEVGGGDEVVVLVHVLVLSPFEELAFHDTGVLLSRLEDLDGIIAQEEADDEPPVNILWDAGVEPGGETQHLLVVVDVLEEVTLWLVGE